LTDTLNLNLVFQSTLGTKRILVDYCHGRVVFVWDGRLDACDYFAPLAKGKLYLGFW
jgi:hypothetical protein